MLENQADQREKEKIRVEQLEKTIHDMNGRLSKIKDTIQIDLLEVRAAVTKFSIEIFQLRKD